jgi:hypothetical protein
VNATPRQLSAGRACLPWPHRQPPAGASPDIGELSTWSAIHGTAMLLLDDYREAYFVFENLVKEFDRTLLEGLTLRQFLTSL